MVTIEIKEPLVTKDLEELESAREVVSKLKDDDVMYKIVIHVSNPDMVPTAIAMSMSKRHNIEYNAVVSGFPGANYIFGYLKSGYFNTVEWRES